MRPPADWRLWLLSTSLVVLFFFLLEPRIGNVVLRAGAALAIVAVGGTLLIALGGAVRGMFDRPR